MTSGLAAGRRLFHPSGHLWLRACRVPTTSVSTKYPWLVDIGISPRGLADIGDVTSMEPAVRGQDTWYVEAGDKLVTIDWDAHSITSADELYHTVWETFSEQTLIRAPISGVVEHCKRFNPVEEELDEETVVVRIRTEKEELTRTAGEMMEEDDYIAFLETIPLGKFNSESIEVGF